MPPLLPTTLRPPPLEFPHLVERESQRLRKLGNGVPACFPRPAFHIPYGGRGYSTLLGEFLYGKPPLALRLQNGSAGSEDFTIPERRPSASSLRAGHTRATP